MIIRETAPAKINLALHVRRRRPDGYHDLETLFAFAWDGDVVTVEEADQDSFEINGPFAAALSPSPIGRGVSGEQRLPLFRSCWGHDRPETGPAREAGGKGEGRVDNLVTKARDAFRRTHPTPPVAITLTKNLPIASGIGGGSADAAATLRALARLTDVDPATLHPIAAKLGADVPACLSGRTALGTGRGDVLVEQTGLAGAPLLLVNPGVPVSTAAVFAVWDGVDRGPLPEGDLLARARAGRNDLEPPAIALAPVIADVRALLDTAPGVILSRMSGSGATCFALFDTPEDRARAADAARSRSWWCLETTLS